MLLYYAHRTSLSRHPAYTIIELLIVIATLAIIVLLAVPTHTIVDQTRVTEAGRLLIADLDGARLRSMGCAADPCVVVLEASGTSYFVARATDPTTPLADPTSGRPWRRVLGDGEARHLGGASVALSGNLLGSVSFTGLGRLVQDTDAIFTVSCNGKSLVIVTKAGTGESRVQP
jgi:type II secretory pathway pseudopilin PulG